MYQASRRIFCTRKKCLFGLASRQMRSNPRRHQFGGVPEQSCQGRSVSSECFVLQEIIEIASGLFEMGVVRSFITSLSQLEKSQVPFYMGLEQGQDWSSKGSETCPIQLHTER